jgi:hypothetical protein
MYATEGQKRIAADRAEQIRGGLQETAVLYAKAVEAEDWRILGYTSISKWATEELGAHRFTTEARKGIVTMLTGAGYSQRKIAAATGAGKSTVNRDQHEAGAPDGAQDTPRQQASRRRELERAQQRVQAPAPRPSHDRDALRREVEALRRGGHPVDRAGLAKRHGCSVGTVQSIRSQADALLAAEREQAAWQAAREEAAGPHQHEWVCRICGEAL